MFETRHRNIMFPKLVLNVECIAAFNQVIFDENGRIFFFFVNRECQLCYMFVM